MERLEEIVADDAEHDVASVQRDAQRNTWKVAARTHLVEGEHLLLHRNCGADRLAALVHDDVEAVVGEVKHRSALPGDDRSRSLDDFVDAVKQKPTVAHIRIKRVGE